MRAESEQGFSKESRLLRNISHHVCNMARLKIPDGANGVDVGGRLCGAFWRLCI